MSGAARGGAAGARASFTVTQRQRLRELGAPDELAEASFDDSAARDAAFSAAERELSAAGRRTLDELRAGPRQPLLRRLEADLRAAITGLGFVEVATPLLVSAEFLDRMGIRSGDALRDQVYWVERDRALRPMLAPNLYTMLRRLGRVWPRPFGIFEVGSCFRRDTKGSRHLSEFTMLNLVELGLAMERRDERLRELAQAVMSAAGLTDYALETTDSEVYGETLDVVSNGVEVCSTAIGPIPMDDEWGIVEPWVGLGFGLERLLLVREGGAGAIERYGRSLTYLDGVRL